jgi:hypothetical protein
MTTLPALRVAALILLAGVLAGCSQGGGGGAPSVRDQAEPVYRELAQCIRDHGYPGFPDPVVNDDGTVELSEEVSRLLEEHEATLRPACEDIIERLPASVREDREEQVTPAQVEERKRFAKCVRDHGVPDFPDPDAAGNIVLSDQPNRRVLNDPATISAFEACGMRGRQGVDLKRGLDELGVR